MVFYLFELHCLTYFAHALPLSLGADPNMTALTSVRKHVSINSILFDHNKQQYRNFSYSFKNFGLYLDSP